MRAFSVGHSTHSLERFVGLLARHGVERLVDVRRTPRSRRHPQLERDSLAAELPARGVDYRHLAALGGRRRPRPDSPNGGWEHEAFRGYADHALTDEFAAALAELYALARERPTAFMCAEAPWWRCHRRLIADRPDRAGVIGLSHRRRRDPRQACAVGVRDRRGGQDSPLSASAGGACVSSACGGCWSQLSVRWRAMTETRQPSP